MDNCNDLLKRIGIQVKKIRTLRHLTVNQLSEMSAVDEGLIVQLECGELDCDLVTLFHIADTLGVKVKDLMTF
ncbi:MAG: hypothetical protein ABJG47_12190 [Ekhidna sp.]